MSQFIEKIVHLFKQKQQSGSIRLFFHWKSNWSQLLLMSKKLLRLFYYS